MKQIVSECLNTLEKIAGYDKDQIEEWADDQVIGLLCSILDRESKIQRDYTVKCLSSIFISDNTGIVDKAIMLGLLPRLLNALRQDNINNIQKRNILWCLSNINSGTESHVAAFMNDKELVASVFECAKSENLSVNGEAMWVICNAVKTASDNGLLLFYEAHSEDLIWQMCEGLGNPRLNETSLILIMIKATSRLLMLDEDNTEGENSVKLNFTKCGGLDLIQGFETHQNQEIVSESQLLI